MSLDDPKLPYSNPASTPVWRAARCSLNLCLFSPANTVYSMYRKLVMTFIRRRARRTLLYERTGLERGGRTKWRDAPGYVRDGRNAWRRSTVLALARIMAAC